jgi:hypothetical protein
MVPSTGLTPVLPVLSSDDLLLVSGCCCVVGDTVGVEEGRPELGVGFGAEKLVDIEFAAISVEDG